MHPREIIKDFLKEIMCLHGSALPPVTSRSSCNTTPNWFQSLTTNTETFHKLTVSGKEKRNAVVHCHSDPHNIFLGLWVPYFVDRLKEYGCRFIMTHQGFATLPCTFSVLQVVREENSNQYYNFKSADGCAVCHHSEPAIPLLMNSFDESFIRLMVSVRQKTK